MKKHPMDVASLVFGMLYAAGGALLLLEGFEVADINIGQLWPGFLVLIGLAILLGSRRADEKAVLTQPEATVPLPRSES